MTKPVLVTLDFGNAAKVTGLPTPSVASDAANKAYVDGLVGAGGFVNTMIAAVPGVNQQDWTIAGRTIYSTVLATPAENSWIGGITAGANGDTLTIFNASTSGLIWMVREDAASSAANRLLLVRQGAFLLPGESLTLVYSTVKARWIETAVSLDVMAVDDKCSLILPGSAATLQAMGRGNTVITATVSTQSPASSPANDFEEDPRTQITNSTAAGTADLRSAFLSFMRGSTAGRQGFFFNSRVRFPAMGATGGVAVGLTTVVATITTLPQSTLNAIYLCADGGQTTLRIWVADGAAGAAVDLGANFPVPSATAAYEVAFLAAPGVASISYMVRRLDSDFRAQGTITANLPSNATTMGARLAVMVGATATASTAQMTRMLTRSLN